MLNWLKEKGLFKRHLSPATVLAISEKKFIEKLYSIHPAAPKQWLDIFSAIRDHKGKPRVLFLPYHGRFGHFWIGSVQTLHLEINPVAPQSLLPKGRTTKIDDLLRPTEVRLLIQSRQGRPHFCHPSESVPIRTESLFKFMEHTFASKVYFDLDELHLEFLHMVVWSLNYIQHTGITPIIEIHNLEFYHPRLVWLFWENMKENSRPLHLETMVEGVLYALTTNSIVEALILLTECNLTPFFSDAYTLREILELTPKMGSKFAPQPSCSSTTFSNTCSTRMLHP